MNSTVEISKIFFSLFLVILSLRLLIIYQIMVLTDEFVQRNELVFVRTFERNLLKKHYY
jgi:hypothetical protein